MNYILIVYLVTSAPFARVPQSQLKMQEFNDQGSCEIALAKIKEWRPTADVACLPKGNKR